MSEIIEKLSEFGIIPVIAIDDAETAVANRAASLSKADLATDMVVEMTSLQGVIGRDYALAAGEPLSTRGRGAPRAWRARPEPRRRRLAATVIGLRD